ncbi:hypothetical protein [Aestuariispira insulae]|uniref:Uncharacterized protein n=1 Tax=Aestuariispira insulae TaxID=1461337 RepID=A0A3D9HJQ1_9PROT|nr:hypothetical protein [Aestuariispira insulae]RED49727.1 hypothetical protein DFP90_10598 [Aestuariispira insulae]
MNSRRVYESGELTEEIQNLRFDPQEKLVWRRSSSTVRSLAGFALVTTVALTAIGGLALASVV